MINFNLISVFRLWAEVFHVSASNAGAVKWQQVSEDLIPISITCIQDSPECIFHVVAYNNQVDKVLDVRIVQPGLWSYSLICRSRSFLLPWYFYLVCFVPGRKKIYRITVTFICLISHPGSRYTHGPSFRMFHLLEGSDDKRYVGLEFHITNGRSTIPRLLCE